MSDVTELKAAVEAVAAPVAAQEKVILQSAAAAAWAKYKNYVYIAGIVITIVVAWKLV